MIMMAMMMIIIIMIATMTNNNNTKKKVSYFTPRTVLYVESNYTINRQFHNGNYENRRINAYKLVKIAHY